MMMNLEADPSVHVVDPMLWTPLQIDVMISIANAKLREFEEQAFRIGELAHLGILSVANAADLLQQAAHYNGLPFAYGQDRVQAIIAAAFMEAA